MGLNTYMLLFEVIELTFLFGVKLQHFNLAVDKEFKREYLNKMSREEMSDFFIYAQLTCCSLR